MTLDLKIILVEPLYQGNIGSVARAMKNFGFSDLILVNPCELKMEARAFASHAYDILESAKTVETIEEALEGSDLVIATTGITGMKIDEHIRMPPYTPRDLKVKFSGMSGTIAVIFGREDHGFTNEELKLSDVIVSIPTSKIYPIMNLSHAVTIILYEMSQILAGENSLADGFDLRLLFEHIDEVLDDIDYPAHKKEKTHLMFKRIFGRAQLMPREVQTLRGFIGKVQKHIK
ncbi:RNA methyltransferase [Methanococcoides burtonii]|uniref:RNA methyltransferase n=1 Tax=Methanococcoides burtonii (strain DSM 6242 / NBRC 107633 / OCM 468 / ACE-M) TaxID=259564 RepID=Q12TE2_METBU|nr:RNA methyltransferase [Methanococcoides burtonii]ABE53284.1 RNA methyltransferase [Methanococcoides burtonii DSM 6242]